jgi:hypothetical protein
MKTYLTSAGYKDVFYSCIPVVGPSSESELNRTIRILASELYAEKRAEIESLLGTSVSKEAWIKRAQRMTINPDYDEDDGIAYITISKTGRPDEMHDEICSLLATKLMSQAPKGAFFSKAIISSDKSNPRNTSGVVWLEYQCNCLAPHPTMNQNQKKFCAI